MGDLRYGAAIGTRIDAPNPLEQPAPLRTVGPIRAVTTPLGSTVPSPFSVGADTGCVNAALRVTGGGHFTTQVGIGVCPNAEPGWLGAVGSSGSVIARNATSSRELHIRPVAGSRGWLSFAEDTVADRWLIGIKNNDATLYFCTGNPGAFTDKLKLSTADLSPAAAGGLALGDTSLPWKRGIFGNAALPAAINAQAEVAVSDGTSQVGLAANAGVGNAFVGTRSNQQFDIITNNTNRWFWTAGGDLKTTADNSYDIGAAGNDPRTIRAKTSFIENGKRLRRHQESITSDVTVTGTTVETDLHVFAALPTLATGDVVEATFWGEAIGIAHNKTIRVKVAGVTIGTIAILLGNAGNFAFQIRLFREGTSGHTLATMIDYAGNVTGALITQTGIDFSGATVKATGQLVNAADSITIYASYMTITAKS